MKQKEKVYIAIDLKSFYASVECIERGLDPMTTNLVVADESRTEKTICLAVSPSLKAYGISGRARLFEVIQRVGEVNQERKNKVKGQELLGSSWNDTELKRSPELAVDYLTAPPRMAHYLEYSTRIYKVYLKYVAPEDCHVYSIDEIMMDVTDYLSVSGMTPREMAETIIQDIFKTTGITATAGIGTNLYLCKVAMDIVAKHIPPGKNGVRVAELNEQNYRRLLWDHRPITDFWRVGRGYAKKLAEHGMYTMGDVARCSAGDPRGYHNEELLYKLFGVSAELLIDHAWGWEPCTMKEIKAYKPENSSICSGQVLQCPYASGKARMVVREMAEMLALDLVARRIVTNQLVLTVGYDRESLKKENGVQKESDVEITVDRYGRKIPKHAHGTVNLDGFTSSAKEITSAVLGLYDRIVNPSLFIRKVTMTANHITGEESAKEEEVYEQLSLFTDERSVKQEEAKKEQQKKERNLQEAVLDIKKKYGKNAVLKGTSLMEGATTKTRNGQIGGHRA